MTTPIETVDELIQALTTENAVLKEALGIIATDEGLTDAEKVNAIAVRRRDIARLALRGMPADAEVPA